MTSLTITERDQFTPDERTAVPQPRLRRTAMLAVVGAFALGGIVGSVVGLTAAEGDSSTDEAPASVTSTPATVLGSTERSQRIDECTKTPRSDSSFERCIAGADAQNQRLEEYRTGSGRVM